MEFNLTTLMAIISIVFCIASFVINRKDKAVKDTKEDNYGLLNYKIDELRKELSRFSDKFDKYEQDIDGRIEKAVDLHIRLYHEKEYKNNDTER